MNDQSKASFWTTLPGVLTGLAGVLTAVGGILAVILANGSNVTMADWAEQANGICAEGYDDIRALGVPADFNSQFQALPRTTRISTRANQRLQALDRPTEGSERIDELLAVASEANVAASDAYTAWSQGDTTTAQARLAASQNATQRVRQLDGQLGANVCAQGP